MREAGLGKGWRSIRCRGGGVGLGESWEEKVGRCQAGVGLSRTTWAWEARGRGAGQGLGEGKVGRRSWGLAWLWRSWAGLGGSAE